MSLTQSIAAMLNQMPVIMLSTPCPDWMELVISDGNIEDILLKEKEEEKEIKKEKVSHSLAKKTAKEMLKNVKEKLGNICITPDTEVYTFLYYNACTLIGLKQYDLASDICIGLYKQLETINP